MSSHQSVSRVPSPTGKVILQIHSSHAHAICLDRHGYAQLFTAKRTISDARLQCLCRLLKLYSALLHSAIPYSAMLCSTGGSASRSTYQNKTCMHARGYRYSRSVPSASHGLEDLPVLSLTLSGAILASLLHRGDGAGSCVCAAHHHCAGSNLLCDCTSRRQQHSRAAQQC